MSFLTPWTAIIAAAVALPVLLLLYFLKLRRRTLRLASTLLWRKSVADVQVNAPFQRLRFTALFLLQLLLLLLLLFASAEPVVRAPGTASPRLILLIDRSASMKVQADKRDSAEISPAPTRFDRALERAKELASNHLRAQWADSKSGSGGAGGGANQVMVIAFGKDAEIVQGFDSRRSVIERAIDQLKPTDEEAHLDAALALAGAFTVAGETDMQTPPEIVLLSDGNLAPPADSRGFMLRGGRFRFERIDPSDDRPTQNLGIVSLSARRDYEDPTRVLVFARLLNAGAEPIKTALTLFADDRAVAVEQISVPAANASNSDATAGGEAVVTFNIELPGGATLRVQHSSTDVLPADDAAALVMPPPARLRLAIVHGQGGVNQYLRELADGLEPESLRIMSLAAYDAMDPAARAEGERFDLIIFDRAAPQRLPSAPSIMFGAVPTGIEIVAQRSEGGKRILSWPRQHPMMRHVSLDALRYADFSAMELPTGATALAIGPDGPVIAVLESRGVKHVVVGFALSRSNWPLDVSFAVFFLNAVDQLTLGRSDPTAMAHQPGQPITVRALSGAKELVVRGPGGLQRTIALKPVAGGRDGGAASRLAALPRLREVGLYRVEGAATPNDLIAVSVLSPVETGLRGGDAVVVNAERHAASDAASEARRGIWDWFLLAALVLLVVEWVVYCRRMWS